MIALSRRALVAGAATLIAADSRPAGAATGGDPIRIGCITPLTGAQEVLGRPILTGAMIAAEQINAAGGVLGRPIEIMPGDGAADPVVAAEAGRTLLAQGVRLFCGGLRSEVAFALWPLMEPADATFLVCGAMSEALTHEMFNRNCFRVCDHVGMRGQAQAKLMAERYPSVTEWAAIVPDIAYGRSAYGAFKMGMEAAMPGRGHVAPPIVTKFGQSDFTAELKALAASPATGLFIGVYGDDAIELYRQARRRGALEKIAVLADSINEFIVPIELGSDVPDNLWLGMHWYYAGYRNLPMGRQLFEDNLKHTGDPMPLGFLNEGHSAVYAYAAALKACGTTQTPALINALEGLEVDTAKGKIKLRREDHQAVCDLNFTRIRTMTGEPGFEVAEFVRYDGAAVIEPPNPGKPMLLAGP